MASAKENRRASDAAARRNGVDSRSNAGRDDSHTADAAQAAPRSWRDVLPIHPAVEMFPPDQLRISDDGLCQHNPFAEKIHLGQEAMARKRRQFEDWLAIAEALEIGRTETMRAIHTNAPKGRRYEKAMADWLAAHSFKEIDKGARSRLLECLQHRDEIQKWRSRLSDAQRFRLNHPDTVLRKWKATVVPDPDRITKKSKLAELKESIAALEEKNNRLEREIDRGGGDLWSAEDRPRDIAAVLLAKLSRSKAEAVARAILSELKKIRSVDPMIAPRLDSAAVSYETEARVRNATNTSAVNGDSP
jgi:hypothetical protein